ncbi:TetR/AcrR family transcriptional regulator [Humibacter antri]
MHSQEDRALRQLWGLEAPTVRGPKPRWTLDQVTATAVALADDAGLDGVSLARVAERLEVTTTALYRYVDSKTALVELMVDAAVGDPPELADDDWRQRCRTWVDRLADRYAEHPWLSDVRPERMPCQPRVYAWIDALVGAVGGRPIADGTVRLSAVEDVSPGSDGGADSDSAVADPLRLALLLDSLVRSYMALTGNLSDAPPPPWLAGALSARFPRLTRAGDQDAADARSELNFAVEAVLRGVG